MSRMTQKNGMHVNEFIHGIDHRLDVLLNTLVKNDIYLNELLDDINSKYPIVIYFRITKLPKYIYYSDFSTIRLDADMTQAVLVGTVNYNWKSAYASVYKCKSSCGTIRRFFDLHREMSPLPVSMTMDSDIIGMTSDGTTIEFEYLP